MNFLKSLFNPEVMSSIRGITAAAGKTPKAVIPEMNMLREAVPNAVATGQKFLEVAKKETGANLQPKAFMGMPELAKNRAPGTRGQGLSESTSSLLDILHDPQGMQRLANDPTIGPDFKKAATFLYQTWHGTLDKADLAKVIPELLDSAGQSLRERTRFSYEPTTYHLMELKKLPLENRQQLLTDPNLPQELRTLIEDINAGKGIDNVNRFKGSEINLDFMKKKSNPDVDTLGGVADPVYSHSLRIQQMLKDVAHYNFLEGAKQKGFLSATPQPGYVHVADIVKDPGIQTLIQKSGTPFIEKNLGFEYADFIKNGGDLGMKNPIRPIHTGWKALMTVWNPKTQIANRMTNTLVSWIDHGVLPGDQYDRMAARVIKQRETNPVYNLAKESGLIDSGFSQSELGQGIQQSLNVVSTAQKPLERAGAYVKGVLKAPGELYQSAETQGKMQIFLKELGKQGITTDGRAIFMNGNPIPQEIFEKIPGLKDAAIKAADSAHKTLVHYGRQSRLIKGLRSLPGGIPFITFYANLYPNMARWATGFNTAGKFDPLVMMRFWSVPGGLWALNEFGKSKTGTTPEQDAANRNALPESYRKSLVPGLHALSNPRMPFNVDAQGNPVSGDTAGSKPAYLPMGNVMPFDPRSSTTGVLGAPSVLMPFQDPLSSMAILSMTGRQPYQQKQLIDKNTPDKAAVLGKEILNQYMPQILKQALPGGRFNSAMQGIPPNQYEAVQSPSMAALNVLSPFRPIGVDVNRANQYKAKDYKNAVNDWRYGLKKDLGDLQLRAPRMTPEQIAEAQKQIVMKYQREMQEWQKRNYPHKPPKGG